MCADGVTAQSRWPASVVTYREWVGVGGVLVVFAIIYVGALHLVTPVRGTGVGTGGGTDDPRIGAGYVVVLLVATAAMLVAFKRGYAWIIRASIIVIAVGISFVVLAMLLPPVAIIGGFPLVPAAAAIGLGMVLALRPRWYVLDVTGVLMGVGAVAVFGIVLGIRPVLVLLVLLAIYDVIAVYGTKHMISLADSAMRDRLPVLLIIPLPGGARSEAPAEQTGHRDALIIGLGDAVIPGMLVASAVVHGPGQVHTIAGIAVSAPAVGAVIGILLGLVALFTVFERGRPHPGLPALNGGAIAGYLVGALLVGISIPQAIGVA